MDSENRKSLSAVSYAFHNTENGYEEGWLRGAYFRRGIAATPQLTQNAESFQPRRFAFL